RPSRCPAALRSVTTYDLPHPPQIPLELPLASAPDGHAKPRQAGGDVVEHALLAGEPYRARARVGAVAVAEQPFEDRARIDFSRQRAGRAAPRHRHVRARVPGIAVAGQRLRLESQLERRELRVPAEPPPGD